MVVGECRRVLQRGGQRLLRVVCGADPVQPVVVLHAILASVRGAGVGPAARSLALAAFGGGRLRNE